MSYNTEHNTSYGEKKLGPGPILESVKAKDAYNILNFGGVDFTCPECGAWISDVSPGQLQSIQQRSNYFLHNCCFSYQPTKEIEQIILNRGRELQDYVERSKVEEKQRSWNGGVVVAGLFGVLPMIAGIFSGDREVAFQGAIFMVIMLTCIILWKWRTK